VFKITLRKALRLKIAGMGYDPSRILAIAAFVLAACSNPTPPSGRWEGVYEDQGLIVAVRLEIKPGGDVRISAPNAITDQQPLAAADRAQLRARLLDGLAKSWPSVPPLPLEFDGKAFHKPSGVAPQLEWDAKSNRMSMIYYSGSRSSVHVPLSAVDEFGGRPQ
jgi:hypothetical protein